MELGHAPSRPGLQGQLQSIVEFLRSEGLYAAEEVLTRELEERFPHKDVGQARSTASDSRPSTPGEDAGPLRGLAPTVRRSGSNKALDTAERVLEIWRSKSATTTPSPQKRLTPGHSQSPPGLEADEYTDDDDPGFWRIDMTGQESAFD
ncbi:hypothetical protein APUTEX25_000148, partial [Auxenochlorella protothecoides]